MRSRIASVLLALSLIVVFNAPASADELRSADPAVAHGYDVPDNTLFLDLQSPGVDLQVQSTAGNTNDLRGKILRITPSDDSAGNTNDLRGKILRISVNEDGSY